MSATDPKLLAVEMRRIVSLKEAARLRGVSVDTLRRTLGGKILRLSTRRLGMRVGDALAIGNKTTD
jgi:hypothetical protein